MRPTGDHEWRRIVTIVPSSNTTVEGDFLGALPPGATLHPARMHLSHTSAEAERRMVTHHVPQAVEDAASLRPWVVAFCCTSAGAVLGAEGEARLIDEIGEKCLAHVVSTNDAVKQAIARHNPRRVAVLTPYTDALNAHIRAGLEGHGLNVVHLAGLQITDNFGICSVSPAEIVAFAERELAGKDFDFLFVSCTNFRAVEARPTLAERFGVPVVTSNQATIDATLATLGLAPAAASEQASAVR
jgi:maleate isomerase